jgi:hypothetical protein
VQFHGLQNVHVFEGTNGHSIWDGKGDIKWSEKSLKSGELGVRQSHRDIMKAVWASGHERVLVLEDDVIPACDLRARLEAALGDEACGRLALETRDGEGGRGGILMLGATESSLRPELLEEVAGSPPELPVKRCYTCNQATPPSSHQHPPGRGNKPSLSTIKCSSS